jgi:hypothetical protein
MRILIINTDYPRFLRWLYAHNLGLERATYAQQMAARNASLFGVADFYSMNFAAHGHPAAELHVNNPWLQKAWAREQGMPASEGPVVVAPDLSALSERLRSYVKPLKPFLRPLARRLGASPNLDREAQEILLAQIEDFRPDLILNQDVFSVDTMLAKRMKSIGRPMLVGQVGLLPPIGQDWSVYDLVISILPGVVKRFEKLRIRAEVCHLAFEPRILSILPSRPDTNVDISFVGTLSGEHRERIALLEAVARRYSLKIWGPGLSSVAAASPLHACWQGEVWGADMYQILRRSRITLNSHIDLAAKEAANMRLFEATGVGAMLLTDYKDNLHELFTPEVHVATWRSIEECLTKIEFYLKNDFRRDEIACAGQTHTITHHNYRLRTKQLIDFVERSS